MIYEILVLLFHLRRINTKLINLILRSLSTSQDLCVFNRINARLPSVQSRRKSLPLIRFIIYYCVSNDREGVYRSNDIGHASVLEGS